MRGVVVEVVGVVTHAVVVVVRPLVSVVGEGVALVTVAVTVSIVINDFNGVGRGDLAAVVDAVAGRHGHGPQVADGRCVLAENRLVVKLGDFRPAFQPANLCAGVGVIFGVGEVVVSKQIHVIVGLCDRRSRRRHVADVDVGCGWRGVDRTGFRNREREGCPGITRVSVGAVGRQSCDVHIDRAASCCGRRPVKGPRAIGIGGVGRRCAPAVNLHGHDADARRGEGAFVDHDVESAVASRNATGDRNLDVVSLAAVVGGREILVQGWCTAAGVAGATLSGLVVDAA